MSKMMEEVSVNYARGEYIKKRCKSAHERLLWGLNLDCVCVCLFLCLFMVCRGYKRRKSSRKASQLSLHLRHRRWSMPASNMLWHPPMIIGIAVSLWGSLESLEYLLTFWKQFVKFLIWRFAKNIFGSPGQKIFINSLIFECTLHNLSFLYM